MKNLTFKYLSFYFSILLSTHAYTTQGFQDLNDKTTYEKGLQHRNADHTDQAVECFLNLAKKGYVKAQHNLAMSYWKLSEDKSIDADHCKQHQTNAYTWFKRASDTGFEPSQRNLDKMDLISLLLPRELLGEIASHLPMKDALKCMGLSKKFHGGIQDLILRTDYYHSDAPFSQHIKALFKDVTFEPKPDSIRLSRYVKSDTSAIEVHFHDTNHLRQIIEHTPMIIGEASNCASYDHIYFVHNKHSKDTDEFKISYKSLETGYFFHVISDTSLDLGGRLTNKLSIVLPQGSNIVELNIIDDVYRKTSIMNEIDSYKKAFSLIAFLDNTENKLFQNRIEEANHLIKLEQVLRSTNPNNYPEFKEFYPRMRFNKTSKDYIYAEKPFIYAARSSKELKKLKDDIPDFAQSISYIDNDIMESGIYSQSPLKVVKGFEIAYPPIAYRYYITINIPEYYLFLYFETQVRNSFFVDTSDVFRQDSKKWFSNVRGFKSKAVFDGSVTFFESKNLALPMVPVKFINSNFRS